MTVDDYVLEVFLLFPDRVRHSRNNTDLTEGVGQGKNCSMYAGVFQKLIIDDSNQVFLVKARQ